MPSESLPQKFLALFPTIKTGQPPKEVVRFSCLCVDSVLDFCYSNLQTIRKSREWGLTMTKYRTKQRQTLLDFLSCHPDEQLSAKQIAAPLKEEGVSMSAVYRNLSELEAEGKVRRCSKPGARDVFYQYIAPCRGCLHLSCTKCGKTFHMHQNQADTLVRQLAETEAFRLDLGNTILYGLCKNCREV